jgi:flagella basal body P-ring formation protein FlgA
MRPVAALLFCLAATPSVADVVVPVRPIPARTILQAADLQVAAGSAPQAIASVDQALGLEARINLYPGRPIREADIGPPAVVERNQIVKLSFATGALTISTDGRALDRAGVGESVRVMNLSSKTIVFGQVRPDGTVEVGQ